MKKIDMNKGFLNLDYHIGKIFFFFLTWKTKKRRKFFFGLIYVKNGETVNISIEY